MKCVVLRMFSCVCNLGEGQKLFLNGLELSNSRNELSQHMKPRIFLDTAYLAARIQGRKSQTVPNDGPVDLPRIEREALCFEFLFLL